MLATTLALATLSGLTIALAPRVVQASKSKPTIAVIADDKEADAILGDVVAVVPSGLKLADSDAVKDRLVKLGQKSSIAVGLDKGRSAQLDRIRKAAHTEGVDIVLIVTIKRDKKGRRAGFVLIVDDESETVSEAVANLGAKKSAEDSDALKEALTAPLGKLVPKKDAPPIESASTPPPPEPPAPPRPEHITSRALFIVHAGYELSGRSFNYNQSITPQSLMPEYNVFPTSGVLIAGEIYPAAGTNIPVLKDLGLIGEYARAIGVKSKQGGSTGPSTEFDTNWQRGFIGLRGRIRTAGDDSASVGLSVGYGSEAFTITGVANPGTLLPATLYNFVRLGADLHAPFGLLSLLGGFGYRFTSGSNDVFDNGFRKASIGGVDFNLGLGYRLATGLDLRIDGRYARFFAKLNPDPGDPFVAGGALDGMYGLSLGVAYVF